MRAFVMEKHRNSVRRSVPESRRREAYCFTASTWMTKRTALGKPQFTP